MGDKVELSVEDRHVTGKKVAKLRRDGYIPAIMYGHDLEAQAIMAMAPSMTKAIHTAGKHQPIEIDLGGTKRLAMVKTLDLDPVKHQLRHVAFQIVRQDEEVETEVPLVITGGGETPAEKAGLVILTTIDTIGVKALPANLPDQVEIPGAKLAAIGDHLTAADLVVPQGVSIITDPDQVIATVYEPSALQAANEAAGGDAEPTEETNAEEGDETSDKPEAASA